MDRRSFVVGPVASAATLASVQSRAQDAYPTRAITMISPFPPGGVSDTITRPLDAALEAVFKQPVVLENKAGAAGAVGAQYVAAAKPDGYTLLSHIVSISGFAAVDKLFDRHPKFTNADFIPLARIVADPIVLIASKDSPYKTLKDLVADAKANPNKVIYSSSGLYGASHIPTVLFARSAGNLEMRPLPTNGGGPAVTAVLGGNVNFFLSPTSIALPHIRAGKVQTLAVSSAKRTKSLPDVPTFKELGYDLESISGSEFSHRREPLARSSTPCAMDSTRPHTASNSSTRSKTSVRNWHTWISRSLLPSGPSTPNAKKMP
ncbi:MAG: tripartite tricarboxylate transporter substrate binding protein [Pseudolabrys sp.]